MYPKQNPQQPTTPTSDPYDFITNPPVGPKKKLLPGGSRKGRAMVAGVGALIVIMLITIIIGILGSGGDALKQDYLSLAQQQTELIRVSGIGITSARQSEARNLAINTSYSLTTQQTDILALAKKAGAPTDVKSLALGKNPKTDDLLTTADQANQFDTAFLETLRGSLQKYRETLKKVRDSSTSTTTRDILQNAYSDVGKLIGEAAPAPQ